MPKGKKIDIPYNFTPRDYQLKLFQALDGGIKRALQIWHRRSGKDKSCLNYMFKEMCRRVGNYYYYFPTYEQGRKALWENIGKDGFRFIEHMPKELISRKSNQEMILELKNGSIFRIIGVDRKDSIVGTNPVGMVFSEFSLQDPEAWRLMSPIARENGAWVIFNMTPRGKNHGHEMYENTKDNPRWYVDIRTVDDTGILTEADIQEERDDGMEEAMVQQEYYCSFNAGVVGSYYGDLVEKAETSGRIGNYPPSDYLTVNTYWDLGVDDSTACWLLQRHQGQNIFIDYFEHANEGLNFYANELKMRADLYGYIYGTHYLPHDAGHRSIQTNQTTAEILEQLCRDYGISDDVEIVERLKIIDGINSARRQFSSCYFNKELCEDGIKKLSLYTKKYDSKRQVYLEHPVHDYTSHCADAFRTWAVSDSAIDFDAERGKIEVNYDFNVYDY